LVIVHVFCGLVEVLQAVGLNLGDVGGHLCDIQRANIQDYHLEFSFHSKKKELERLDKFYQSY